MPLLRPNRTQSSTPPFHIITRHHAVLRGADQAIRAHLPSISHTNPGTNPASAPIYVTVTTRGTEVHAHTKLVPLYILT